MATLDLSALTWRKSSRSSTQANCVEIAMDGRAVAARDSKAPEGGALVFTAARWGDFLRSLRAEH